MSQTSTRPPWHAPVHDLIMLHMLSSVRSTRGSQEQRQAAAGHMSSRHGRQSNGLRTLGHEAVDCNLSRDAAACASRERLRPISTSHSVWKHTLVEVDVCVAPEPLRLVEGSSNASGRVVASPAVAAGAAGCSGAGFTATLRSDNFSRFLD